MEKNEKKDGGHSMLRRSQSKKIMKPIIKKKKGSKNHPKNQLPTSNRELSTPEAMRPGPSFVQTAGEAANSSLEGSSQSWSYSGASEYSSDPGPTMPINRPRTHENRDFPFAYNQMPHFGYHQGPMMVAGPRPFPFPVAGVSPRLIPSVVSEPASVNMHPFTEVISANRIRYPLFSIERTLYRRSVFVPRRIETRPYHIHRPVYIPVPNMNYQFRQESYEAQYEEHVEEDYEEPCAGAYVEDEEEEEEEEEEESPPASFYMPNSEDEN